jgi:hypothetical protein
LNELYLGVEGLTARIVLVAADHVREIAYRPEFIGRTAI